MPRGGHPGPSPHITLVPSSLVGRASGSSALRGFSPVANTRMRLVRRLIFTTIVVIGLALAASQFDGVQQVATGIGLPHVPHPPGTLPPPPGPPAAGRS